MSESSSRPRPPGKPPSFTAPRVTLRLDFDATARIGPGKVRLLEAVAARGSISAAARAVGMSYRQAWKLLDQLNGMFRKPLVTGHVGGAQGGGAELTALGTDVVRRYRTMESAAAEAAAPHLTALGRQLRSL